MKTSLFFGFALLVAGLLATASSPAHAQERGSGSSGTVKVKLNYTGSGTVDEKHKIFIALWNSPDFMTGGAGMPIGTGSATSKNGTVTLTNVTASPVYVSAAYDSSGNSDGQSGPPPSGTSLGIYSKTPGKPEPIDLSGDKTAEVELTFDDSIKMP